MNEDRLCWQKGDLRITSMVYKGKQVSRRITKRLNAASDPEARRRMYTYLMKRYEKQESNRIE